MEPVGKGWGQHAVSRWIYLLGNEWDKVSVRATEEPGHTVGPRWDEILWPRVT